MRQKRGQPTSLDCEKKRGTHLERARGFHGDSLRRSSYTRISRGYLPSRLASLGDAYVEYLAGACTMNLRGKAQATAHACARAQTLAQACGLFDRAAYLLLDGFTLDAVGGPLSASAARQPAAGKRPCRSPPGWGRGPAPLRGAGAGRLGTPRRALSLHFRASLLPRALQACDAPKKFPTLEYWRFASGVFRNNCDAQTGQEKRKPRARSSIVSSAVAGFFLCFAASARSSSPAFWPRRRCGWWGSAFARRGTRASSGWRLSLRWQPLASRGPS